ncbi:MAG: HEAT repeat domain-containing protein, partial [bacterium]
PEAEKQLTRALKDKDWEVVCRAAEGLGQVPAGKQAVKALIKLAWDGDTAQQRLAAARSLALIDAEAGLKGLVRKLTGERAPKVCASIVLVASALEDPSTPKALGKLVRHKQSRTRAAAARALVVCTRTERPELLEELFASEYVAVVAAALEAVIHDPRGTELPALMELLRRPRLLNVLERRALRAAVASAGALEGEERGKALQPHISALSSSTEKAVAARGPRLAMEASGSAWTRGSELMKLTSPAREHPATPVRAAAAHALGFFGKEALEPAREMAASDKQPRVRQAALASALALEGIEKDGQLNWVLGRLESESHPSVREELLVALGQEKLGHAVEPLTAALTGADDALAVCAAVSLGRTRMEAAVAPLSEVLKSSESWRRRGGALVGLCSSFHKDAVAPVIEALLDPEPLVARTAFGFLRTISRGKDFPAEVQPWRDWWKQNEKRLRLADPKELEERRKRLGYSALPGEVYKGLDVLVLESRGDHIQNILQELAIEHRLTAASRVVDDGLDAAGVFVSNCTGEMEVADVERLEWFVRVGGYLFGSCWAVHETIERIAPGRVRKLATRNEVLDKVLATPWALDSPYTEGVFQRDVQPIYSLVGAHLIEVIEPERVEVLVDSPECAEAWGGGNLACWFRFGHGKILDSVNHFDLQGLAEATWLKKPEERMAYAMDHMGTSFARIRETRKEKFWKSNTKASREIRDYSVFKLITNFVRLRRLADL